jgi:hypothetical protein
MVNVAVLPQDRRIVRRSIDSTGLLTTTGSSAHWLVRELLFVPL